MATKTKKGPMISISIDLPEQRVRDLLNCAFNDTRSWFVIDSVTIPAGRKREDYEPGGKFYPKDAPGYHEYSEIVPFCKGGKVIIEDKERRRGEKKFYTIDHQAILRGLALMPTLCPNGFGQFMEGNEDSLTGYNFIQLCVFGELRYG